MITDTLDNLQLYKGLHKNLDTAVCWLQNNDVAALPLGKTEIDGENVYVNVMEADLRPAEGAEYEYHRRYADLQIDVTGSEHWGWAAAASAELTQTKPYDGSIDAGFCSGDEQAGGVLGEKRFVLFFPPEPHKPSCINGNCIHVRKAVVKISMD